jgi:amino acid transporter
MKNTHRDLPRALHSSMTIVLFLFLGANISYFIVLSPETVASTNTVALDFGRETIGKFGALVFSTLVSISCFGALSNSFYTSRHTHVLRIYELMRVAARLIHASAKDHFLPDLFARLHPNRRTPDNAMFLQASLTSFFVVFGGGFRSEFNTASRTVYFPAY